MRMAPNATTTTIVLIKVARSELIFATPIFAKIAVRAAKKAERRAHAIQPVGNITVAPPIQINLPRFFTEPEKSQLGLIGNACAAIGWRRLDRSISRTRIRSREAIQA
jgi:hypothetical protein